MMMSADVVCCNVSRKQPANPLPASQDFCRLLHSSVAYIANTMDPE